MASEPKEEHSYILDSFEEFEALARRALHEGISYCILCYTHYTNSFYVMKDLQKKMEDAAGVCGPLEF